MNETRTPDRPWIVGLVLIAIGVIVLAGELFEPAGWLILGAIAAIFFALYAGTRRSGFIIPGMILAGLAVGVGLEEGGYSTNGWGVLLGLAAGFVGIYVFNVFTSMKAHWWPLIPGAVLAIIGVSLILEGTEAAGLIQQLWPVALIAAGLLVLLGEWRAGRARV